METERFHVSELIVILKQILSLPNRSGTYARQPNIRSNQL